jgi:hypothetical protein
LDETSETIPGSSTKSRDPIPSNHRLVVIPITMPIKETETPYPLIDADPHFGRVIRYMRPSDYAMWAGAAAAGPGALYFMGR